MLRVVAISSALLVACDYSPPRGVATDAPDDTSIDTPPVDAAPVCFGAFTQVCVAEPTTPRTLGDTVIDTTSSPLCAASNVDACVVAATSITVTGVVSGVGSRPLIFLATAGPIRITGTLDVSSHRGGPGGAGFGIGPCDPGVVPGDRGGGQGGSFGASGADGGGGSGQLGGVPGAAATLGSSLRGGCAGGNGAGGTPGTGGMGGGVVELISEIRIEILGTVNASGAGATGGVTMFGGGGGGGSGGLIVLAAPMISLQGATLFANGGGGAEGANAIDAGAVGDDPVPPVRGDGGSGGNTGGGAGGDGSLGGVGTDGVTVVGGSGGGGGGGAGMIRATSTTSGTATVSPSFQ